ncbi:MAG: guanylate kinase [Armatimonadetes bacterium]|nr:guanylate kinase [Armatimonadota bacterium]
MSLFQSNNFLIILISPSAGGKSVITKQVLKKCDNIEYSISITTRKPRGNEINGKAYFFTSEEEFQKRISDGDFLEYALVHGKFYGTSKSVIKKILSSQKHAILDIDVQGAKQIIASGIDAVTIFILPPSAAILKERLFKRGTDSKEKIEERLQDGIKEIDEVNNFDYLAINDDLNDAVDEVINIIKIEEKRICRYENIKQTFYGGELVK